MSSYVAYPGHLVEQVVLTLLRSGVSVESPLSGAIQRLVRQGDRWKADITLPIYQDRQAGMLATFLDQLSRYDRWAYISPPAFGLGTASITNAVTNGDLMTNATTAWSGNGASISANAQKLVITNSAAAEGYAIQSVNLSAGSWCFVGDCCPTGGSPGLNARMELRDGGGSLVAGTSWTEAGRILLRTQIGSSGTYFLRIYTNSSVNGLSVAVDNIAYYPTPSANATASAGATTIALVTNSVGTMLAGEFVTISTSAGYELKRLTDDYAANNTPIYFEPALRGSVSVGAPILYAAPFFKAVLSEQESVTTISAPNIHGFTIAVTEDVT